MKINMPSVVSCFPALMIAVVVAVAAPSFAAPQMEERGESMLLQLRQLHDRLQLTVQQESLWKRAENGSRDEMRLRQAGRRQAIEEAKQALMDPQADLRALSGKMDARREMAAQEFKETRELWLSLYASLDEAQRAMVRKFLLERTEYLEGRRGA